jgi:hypothetical protein
MISYDGATPNPTLFQIIGHLMVSVCIGGPKCLIAVIININMVIFHQKFYDSKMALLGGYYQG